MKTITTPIIFCIMFSVALIANADQQRQWDLRQVDIRTVINEVAQMTQRQFVIDAQVKGKVSFSSAKPLSAAESYKAFAAMLDVLGYAAHDDGSIIRIVPEQSAVEAVVLVHAQAHDVAGMITALERKDVAVSADERSNAVIISGEALVRGQIKRLIQRLDQIDNQQLAANTQVVPLQFLRAVDAAPILAGVAQAHFNGDVGVTVGSVAQTVKGLQEKEVELFTNERAKPVQHSEKLARAARARIEIIAEANTNTLILNAPPVIMNILKRTLSELDVAPAQIHVDALVIEIDEDDLYLLGLDWETPNLRYFNSGVGVLKYDLQISNLQARIHALEHDKKVNVISRPSLAVLDNHQAKILVGKEVSIRKEVQEGADKHGKPQNTRTTFSRRDVALYLYVTPHISKNRSMLLKLDHGYDTLQNPMDSSDTPIFNKNKINTTVLVNDGEWIVLGGMVQERVEQSEHGVPLLSDIPGFGQLFKTERRHLRKKLLMIFLQPNILS